MQNEIELLSPAGTWEAMISAVNSGADAVYLGVNKFNARQKAGNFDTEKLTEAIRFCHIRDVKVYLTLNTLIRDSEINELLETVISAWNAGIDAIIVQDLGVAKLVKEAIPNLSLHASTQMTIHNIEGIQVLKGIGFDRVVLARELSIEEIQYICQNSNMQIEVFVHGALCVSYSGQCLMSSMIGGRSGNMGVCAQPCRLPYRLIKRDENINVTERKEYLLSLKDLSLIEHLDSLRQAGVKSLKIEGRLKRPEYVYTVTRLYRKYLDKGGDVSSKDKKMLLKAFNRSGFTKGYFEGQKGKDMFSTEKPNHHGTFVGNVDCYDKLKRTVKVVLADSLSVGDGIEIWCSGGENAVTKIYEMKTDKDIINYATKGQYVSFRIEGSIKKGEKVYKTFDAEFDKEIKSALTEESVNRVTALYGHVVLSQEKPMLLRIWEDEGNYVEVEGDYIPQIALKKETDIQTIKDNISKTGGTNFKFVDITIEVEKGLYIPISEINGIRRRALELMEDKRLKIYERQALSYDKAKDIAEMLIEKHEYKVNNEQELYCEDESSDNRQHTQPIISVQVENISQAKSIMDLKFDRLYLPLHLFIMSDNNGEIKNICKSFFDMGIEVFCVMPEIYRKNDIGLYDAAIISAIDVGADKFLISNISQIKILKKYGNFNLYGDFRLNVANSFSVICLKELSLKGITVSPELSLKEIKRLKNINGMQKEMISYGRIPLMIVENCIVDECGRSRQKKGCNCRGEYAIIDRKNVIFPIICDSVSCRTKILNSVPIFMGDKIDDLKNIGVHTHRLMFTVEEPDETHKIASLYIDLLKKNGTLATERYTEIVKRIKEKGFTRGYNK